MAIGEEIGFLIAVWLWICNFVQILLVSINCKWYYCHIGKGICKAAFIAFLTKRKFCTFLQHWPKNPGLYNFRWQIPKISAFYCKKYLRKKTFFRHFWPWFRILCFITRKIGFFIETSILSWTVSNQIKNFSW